MQTFDDADILGLMWLGLMFAALGAIYIVAAWSNRRDARRRLPKPQARAVVGHARWYRVTTSRVNDRKGI